MSYIICAEVDTTSEVNMHADRSKVDARVLSERGGIITFDVRGDHTRQRELVGALCATLIEAGFYEFQISHSY